ncbi:DUF6764 family protein [Gordonia neofelifaecis]|uniref:Secreted protein n=1 Tax=Gordonia neofelifaecis NRRL B-59395 TaxID=644548 RepID=F1YND6_9ACTN|nr:DUF6764 family protein [Gordonia neofelifaecis]EGD53847.1 hypothetical protein SCNU_17173 [Gordonia neofelifaecis NRRL B-59395]
MRFGSWFIRVFFGSVAVAAAFGLTSLAGGGDAGAATHCSADNNQRVERANGQSHCIANAGPGSRATAEDSTNNGAALAVATTRGTATAQNNGVNSSALASGIYGGNGYAYTMGPYSTSVAQGRNSGTTVAVSGAAGGAFATSDGVACLGSMAATYDSTTGRGCFRWGEIYLH